MAFALTTPKGKIERWVAENASAPRRHQSPTHNGDDQNPASGEDLVSPDELRRLLPLTAHLRDFVAQSRQTIRTILDGADPRLLVVVGPCSIHDPEAALEYAHRLSEAAEKLRDTLYLVMRVYLEKPRTSTGWKGLINDPDLDGSSRIDLGLTIARGLLIRIGEQGVPAAIEAVEPMSQRYLEDLVSWTAIGARTVESQTHREMASGLASPIGFKNGTDGDLTVALNAMKAAAMPHGVLGINGEGRPSIRRTPGNTDTHIVLRGGDGTPNYASVHVERCERMLREHGFEPRIMIDCSHANAQKNHERQLVVLQDVVNQILTGNQSIRGVMLESNLYAGSQPLTGRVADLRYGVSITDPCLDWETTERGLSGIRDAMRAVLPGRRSLEQPPAGRIARAAASAPRQPTIVQRLNLCTSTLPAFTLDDSLGLAAAADYDGVELRVHDRYHISLPQLYNECERIIKQARARLLEVSVYNTYYSANDAEAIDALIRICQRTGVRYFRVTLPIAGAAGVRTQAVEDAVVPGYEHRARPTELLRNAKACLQGLATRAKAARVCALVEMHWGTIMSSFTSAYHLIGDLDPEAIALTFDPANLLIEGKEDWEYGLQLMREHVANVHVKNVSWLRHGDEWKWRWDTLQHGMVDWPQLFGLLADSGYSGLFAVEDFRVPRNLDEALRHLRDLREETAWLLSMSATRQAA